MSTFEIKSVECFLTVRYGLERNYRPMKEVFKVVIEQSLKAYEGYLFLEAGYQ